MSTQIDEAIQGARLLNFLPYLEEEIGSMDRVLVQKVFTMLRDGSLTPDVAMSCWQEKFAYDNLLRRVKTKAQMGQAMGEKYLK